jgi:hypothetical protein
MPYRVSGSTVYVQKGGKWHKKQTCKSAAAAHSAMRLLNAIKHGFKPTGG